MAKPVALTRAACTPALFYNLPATRVFDNTTAHPTAVEPLPTKQTTAHCFGGQVDGETSHTVDTTRPCVYGGVGGDRRPKERDGVLPTPWASARGTAARYEVPIRPKTTLADEWRPRMTLSALKTYSEGMPEEDQVSVQETRASVRGPQRWASTALKPKPAWGDAPRRFSSWKRPPR